MPLCGLALMSGRRATPRAAFLTGRPLLDRLDFPCVYVSADEPTLRDAAWLRAQWDRARLMARDTDCSAVLALDEVQKVVGWFETVKRCWDEDTRARLPLKVVVLGSAPLLMQQRLTESLAGRFEVLRLPHWSSSRNAGDGICWTR